MNKIYRFAAVALLLCATIGAYGQSNTPEKVVIDTKDYYQHGFNGNGTNQFDGTGKAIVKAQEVRDSVTVGSTMKYFVLPDPNYNSTWYNSGNLPSDVTSVTGLVSSFTWTIQTVSGGAGSTSSTTHIAPINWTATGTANIKVQEVPSSSACVGNETSIPVVVIPKPTITFTQVGTPPDYKDGACYTQAQVTAGINYSFPVAVTSASSQIKVDYSIVFTPLSGSPVTTTATNVLVTGGVLPITLQNTGNLYGSYAVTVTKVTDRVSRKSGVESTGSDLLTAGGSATFTYNVLKPAETGPIYRLPNNGNY